VLESVGGATLDASLAATKRVTGRVVVFGLAGGDAAITKARATVGKLALLP
jgi:NADPH:quinone reductase